MQADRPVVLLGPQRFRTTARAAVRSLAVEGPIATVNAGWEDRESDDGELDGVLDGRSVNLRLHARMSEILDNDPELAEGNRRRNELLAELQAVYSMRLLHALDTVYALQRRTGPPGVLAEAIEDAIAAVRALDDWHARTVDAVHEEFVTSYDPLERPAIVHHRAEVARLVDEAGAVVVTGGHVGVLLDVLALFEVAEVSAGKPLVAWSAGAMALCDRVVMFNDFAPQNHGEAEVWARGLGVCRGVVALPHARRRLRLDDTGRMSVFARRFADARCVVLDDGVRVDVGPDGGLPPATKVIDVQGRVRTAEEAA
jgi:hypothetical protein